MKIWCTNTALHHFHSSFPSKSSLSPPFYFTHIIFSLLLLYTHTDRHTYINIIFDFLVILLYVYWGLYVCVFRDSHLELDNTSWGLSLKVEVTLSVAINFQKLLNSGHDFVKFSLSTSTYWIALSLHKSGLGSYIVEITLVQLLHLV